MHCVPAELFGPLSDLWSIIPLHFQRRNIYNNTVRACAASDGFYINT